MPSLLHPAVIAIAYLLGVATSVTASALAHVHYRRLTNATVGKALTSLVLALGDLTDMLPPTGPLATQAALCRELAASVARLVNA